MTNDQLPITNAPAQPGHWSLVIGNSLVILLLLCRFAAADASLAMGEVRVVTPTGVSSPLSINVGHLPEVAEKEPDNTLEQAQLISLPAAISGTIGAPAQIDYYRFKAAKGQELVFEVD